MSWVRIDDTVINNQKLRDIPRATRWVWVAGLAFSSANRFDGYVPRWAPPTIEATARDVRELIRVGLWTPNAAGGWQIHDYGQYQPVNGELSAKRSAAGRKGAQSRWQT